MLVFKEMFFKFWIKYFHFYTCRSPNPSHRPSAPPVSMRTEANDGLKCGETSYWDSDFKCFSGFSLCSNFHLKKSVLVTIIVSGRNTLTYINSFHQKGLMKKHVFAPKIEMVAKPDFVCSSSYQFLVFESLSESKAACSNISFKQQKYWFSTSCSNTSFNHKSISSFFYPYRQACSGTPASKFFIFLVSDLFTSTRSVASSEGSPLKISKDYHPTHVVSCPRWGNRKSESFF